MKRKLAMVAAVTSMALLAGCGESAEESADSTPEPAAKTPNSQSEEVAQSAPEEPKPDEPKKTVLNLGETATLTDVALTVHAFDPDAATDGPQPDSENDKWAAVDMEICISPELEAPDGLTISTMPWTIADADNRHWQPSGTGYGTFPEPAYAWGMEPIEPGECRRGWTVFVVGKDAPLTTIDYRNDSGEKASWAIS